jgi:hypothetical protein
MSATNRISYFALLGLQGEEALEKRAQAKWRTLKNLPKLLKQLGGHETWTLAHTKQNLSSQLGRGFDTLKDRAPNWALKQDPESYRRRLTNGVSIVHGSPSRLSQSAREARLGMQNIRTERPDTHKALFDRVGRPIATPTDVPDVLGDRLFRGVKGGDPWGGGYYNGLFNHATPSRHLAYQYGNSLRMRAVNHHQLSPGQMFGNDLALELNVLGVANKAGKQAGQPDKFRLSHRQKGDFIDARGQHYETALTKERNPYLGTELRLGDSSKFVDASDTKGRRAVSNYLQQMNAKSAPDVGRRWDNSLRAQPRLGRMEAQSPESFKALMRRRADRLLFAGEGKRASVVKLR